MDRVIDRPETSFDGASHTYKVEGQGVVGVSSVAKVGGVEETWGIASAWGFKIGWQGALEVLSENLDPWDKNEDKRPIVFGEALFSGEADIQWPERETLYQRLKKRGLTPWSKRDKAAERGNWVHDALEQLAQHGTVERREEWSEEVWGHVRGVYAWYVKFRPEFVAVEVQVASREHGFAGRYDIRAIIAARHLLSLFVGHTTPQSRAIGAMCGLGAHGNALCLVDLKTSKGVYPTTHFPQLAGYEGGSVEMGFPATDAQFVLNTHPDGTFDFVPSWATYDDFLAYLGALRAVRRIKAEDPEEKRRVVREQAILLALPARSRELAETLPELRGLDGRAVGFILGSMRKRGLVKQLGAGVWDRA